MKPDFPLKNKLLLLTLNTESIICTNATILLMVDYFKNIPRTLFFLLLLAILMTSCEKREGNRYLVDSGDFTEKTKEPTPSPSTKNSSKEILLFIKEFVEKDFYGTHQELVDQGKEYGYQFSEIQHLGNMIKYSFEIPDVEGYQEYSCIPNKGETTTLISGDHQVVKLYFDGLELSKKWDRRNSTESGHVLEIREEWKDYPITTHILATYLLGESESTLIIRRKLVPH